MSRVLVVWEDSQHDKLDLCLRRAIRHLGLPPPALYFTDCRGNGGFIPYLKKDWLKACRVGLIKSNGPIDHLVCVADADRAHECCPVDNPSIVAAPTAPWLARADALWTDKLRAEAPVGPERVHGRFLRWSQESLLIAAHDVDETLAALRCRDRRKIQKHLEGCAPSPLSIPDAEFADAFRKPERCLSDMLKAAGVPVPQKGASPRSDALEAASARAIDRLSARVPELPALARLVSDLGAA
ncbi:MAG: hypothetical protein U0359_17790 [Byssovorax sp.]